MPESVIFIVCCGWLIWSSHTGYYESPVMSMSHSIGFRPLLSRCAGMVLMLPV
jgi:hypothetical protein